MSKTSDGSFASLLEVACILEGLSVPWVFCGGWSIDLFLHRVTRLHKDVDIAVGRRDQGVVQEYLTGRGWTLQIAHDGRLTPWESGQQLRLPRHGIWASCPGERPDFFEILLNEIDDTVFRFRRDTSIAMPLGRAFTRASSGLPALAPEIALLYKAAYPEAPESRADFQAAQAALRPEQRTWLVAAMTRLYPDHPWLPDLEAERPPA